MSGVFESVHLDVSEVGFPISPSPDSAAFWEALQRGELLLPHCGSCRRWIWYPRSLCPHCGSLALEWLPHDGHGTVHAFCIQHQTSAPHLRPLTPFVTVLVDLAPDVRMMGLLDVDPGPDSVRCGTSVRLRVAPTDGDRNIAVFVPDPAPDGA